MNDSIFRGASGLDTEYLDAAYADDADTAAMVFEQFLQDLPANLDLINESIRNQDIERFRHHIHKQKPGFSYVGLTDVTQVFQDLQVKCLTKEDMQRYKSEIDQVLHRIQSSTPVIRNLLERLKAS